MAAGLGAQGFLGGFRISSVDSYRYVVQGLSDDVFMEGGLHLLLLEALIAFQAALLPVAK